MRTSIGVDDAIGLANEIGFVENHNHFGCLNELQGSHRCARDAHGFALIFRIVPCCGAVLTVKNSLDLCRIFRLVRRLIGFRPIVSRSVGIPLALKPKFNCAVRFRLSAIRKWVIVKSCQIWMSIWRARCWLLGFSQSQVELLQALGGGTAHCLARWSSILRSSQR